MPSSRLPDSIARDSALIVREALRIMAPGTRRAFLQRGASLGGLALLSGCQLDNQPDVEALLQKVSRFNDSVQAALFDPRHLAPSYPASMMTRPFPFNAYYDIAKVPHVSEVGYRLEVSGLVAKRQPWTLERLRALPQTSQITRHICVEGWSAIGRWGGVSFSRFLAMIGADRTARYVAFKCADDYFTSIDMPTALHPQTLLALSYDGQVLPPQYGFPMKLRMPTKLGYKNPKHIMAIEVTNTYPGGYWENRGYNWFGGS